jgi:long-chain acyl-CoA synthetase
VLGRDHRVGIGLEGHATNTEPTPNPSPMSALDTPMNRTSNATPNPKPWLDQYPTGIPAQVKVDPQPSLVDFFDECFARHGTRVAGRCMNRSITYAGIDADSRALAAWLQSKGLKDGTRVALMMPNVLQYMVAIPAVLRAGCTVVNVNPLYTARELEHQLNDSGAQAIIVLENFATTLEEVIERTSVRHVVLASMGDLLGFWKQHWINFLVRHVAKLVPEFKLPLDGARSVTRYNDAVALGRTLTWQKPPSDPDAVAFLQYTGGTTGVSKGATLLHRNLVANIAQSVAWFKPVLDKAGTKQLEIVCALPLYHIYALTVCYMMGAQLGGANLLIPNPRDIRGLVTTLRERRVNMFPAVNTLFNTLAHDAEFAKLDFSGLVVSSGGGMAVQEATAQKWLAVTGCPICEGYGLSETSPAATSNRLDLQAFTGTIGVPLPNTDIAIRDDDGRDVATGEPGEICIRGPQVMAGYWQRPDETAKVMTDDGYFKSGDVGVMDARGYIKIVDRKKDMILVSGFNVYPNEIEQVVGLHPAVLEAAAIGVPDERSGEAVKLFVVRNEGTALSEEELASYCRENFTAYKRPKFIEFRDELPKSNVGKILRRELRSGL